MDSLSTATAPGHLFVVHGDLKRLACAGLLLPCDGVGDLNPVWGSVLPDGAWDSGWDGRLRLTDLINSGGPLTGLVETPIRVVGVVDTVSGSDDIQNVVRRVSDALRAVAERLGASSGSRSVPLIGMPLVLTGQGGFDGRRGDVLAALLPALGAAASEIKCDIALVLHDRRDYLAAQAARPGFQEGLGRELTGEADRLGELAAAGGLSLFVGAGASIPAGMPSWSGVLDEIAAGPPSRSPGDPVGQGADALMRRASNLRAAMGELAWRDALTARFKATGHGVGHALLAGLELTQMVTTNVDDCMELALGPVHGEDGFRVLTRHVVQGALPWLLKLHGDVARPETFVFTAEEYEHLSKEQGALHGTIAGLLLTSHLLFVGYSLADEDFLALASDVEKVRARATGQVKGPVGTALALHRSALTVSSGLDDLEVVAMSEEEDLLASARTLEIFLDRIAWRAARSAGRQGFFLDPRYDAAFPSAEDSELRRRLGSLMDDHGGVEGSAAWETVKQMLRDLGADVADH